MTLVMAYADPATREITMCADSHAYDSDQAYPNIVKIDRRQLVTKTGHDAGTLLLGHAGEHSIGMTARNVPLPFITIGEEPQSVIDKVAQALQRYGSELAGGINYHGGTEQIWLVGWNGHLWQFVHYDVLDARPFSAIGAASSFAYGAWDALSDEPPFDDFATRWRLERVGNLTAARSHMVRPPWKFETAKGVTQ